MDSWIAYTVLGIALGSVYAIAATGLVVTYATSGIFNFAHGGIATVSALVYWQLKTGWGLQTALAAALTILVFAPALGAVIEFGVMRNLRGTNEITQVVVPIAVLLALQGAATWVWYQENQVHQNAYWFGAGNAVRILGQPLRWHQVTGIILSALVAFVLYLLLRRTRVGVTMRATVDDRELLMMNGGRPDRMSMLSWAIGAALAAVAGVLLSPERGSIEVTALTLMVFSAYPAALAGKLRSVPIAYASAMAFGIAVNWWTKLASTTNGSRWPAFANLRLALPALLLFVVLILLPQDRLRGAVVTRTRERFSVPTLRSAIGWAGVLIAVVAMLQALMSNADVISLATGMGLAVMALSLVVLTGYGGQINLAVYTFAGIATIAAWQFDVGPGGKATRESMSIFAILLAIGVCMIVGGLIALPALRLRGLYLGLATFAFAIVVDLMVMQQGTTLHPNIFGWSFEVNLFTNRSLTVPRPHWFGIDFMSQRNYLMLLTVAFALIGTGLIALRRSAYGQMLVAMKDSPAACATLGMNIVRIKLSVFMLSTGIAGLGGLLWAAQIRTTSNTRFDTFLSLSLFMLTVIGGVGYVSGALFAGLSLAVLSVVLPEIFLGLGDRFETFHWLFSSGIGRFSQYLAIALAGIGLARNPSGIVQTIVDGFSPLRRARGPVAVWIAAVVLLWFLTWRGVVSNWTFALILTVSTFVVPVLIKRRMNAHQPSTLEVARLNAGGEAG